MNFNFFNFNLEISFSSCYDYETLVYPITFNGELDEDSTYAYGGNSFLQAYYQGWKRARLLAGLFSVSHNFVARRCFSDIEKPRPEDWEVVRFRTIKVKTQVSFFSC